MKSAILILSLMLSAAAHADRYFVEPVRGGSASEGDREAITELISLAVPGAGNHTVVSNKEAADYTLSGSIMKLGDSVVVSLQKKNKAGQVVFGEKMKAISMDEADTVATRLTRAVITQQNISETADVTNITREEETMNSRRYNATRQWVIGLGPGWTSNLDSTGGGFTFLLGFLWGLDPDFSINLSWTINNGRKDDDSRYTDFSLGGEYYFTRTKHSPFVGARLG